VRAQYCGYASRTGGSSSGPGCGRRAVKVLISEADIPLSFEHIDEKQVQWNAGRHALVIVQKLRKIDLAIGLLGFVRLEAADELLQDLLRRLLACEDVRMAAAVHALRQLGRRDSTAAILVEQSEDLTVPCRSGPAHAPGRARSAANCRRARAGVRHSA
jgi:hypothetical protein